MQKPIGFLDAFLAAQKLFSLIHCEEANPHAACLRSSMVIYTALLHLPQRIDLHRCAVCVKQAAGREHGTVNQAQTVYSVFRVPFAIALKHHRQNHANIVGEVCGAVKKRQREPCPIP